MAAVDSVGAKNEARRRIHNLVEDYMTVLVKGTEFNIKLRKCSFSRYSGLTSVEKTGFQSRSWVEEV